MFNRRLTRRLGQSLVELALAAPVLLLLLAGGADLARAYFAGIEVQDGARDAALYMTHHPGTGSPASFTASQLKLIVESGYQGSLLSCPTGSIQISPSAQSPGPVAGTYLQDVTVTCQMAMVAPGLPFGQVRVTGVATAVLVPEPEPSP